MDNFFEYSEVVFKSYRKDENFRKRQMLEMIPFLGGYLSTVKENSFSIYSGHDYTIEALLSIFDVIFDQPIRSVL